LALATLSLGEAATFNEGEDAPILVQVPRAKGGSRSWLPDQEVAQAMANREEPRGVPDPLLPAPDCQKSCLSRPAACELARRLIEDSEVMRAISRTVFSAIQNGGGLGRTRPDLEALVESRCPEQIEPDQLLAAVAVHGSAALASRRGAQAGWTYGNTVQLGTRLCELLDARLDNGSGEVVTQELREAFLSLQGGGYGPFPACERIWNRRNGPCLCRYPIADLVASGGFDDMWSEALDGDRSTEDGRPMTWDACQDGASYAVEFPDEGMDSELFEQLSDTARRTALCFAQQMLMANPWSHPRVRQRAIDELMKEADHE
jgi:hypothetical protein